MASELIVKGVNKVVITPDPGAVKARDLVIKQSVTIKRVTTPDEDTQAKDQVRELAQIRINVNKAKDAEKAPITALGRLLESVTTDFLAPVIKEEERIKKERAGYADKVEQRRLEAAKELRKIEADKAKLEERRLQQLDKAEEAEDDSPIAAAKAEAKVEVIEQKIEQVEQREQQLAVVVESEEPRGIKKVWDYDENQMNLAALYGHNPRLVQLSIKRREVLEELQRLEDRGEPVVLPGLKTTLRTKVSSR